MEQGQNQTSHGARRSAVIQATKASYRPPWASPGELPSCWTADEDDSPSCGRLLCRSCPSPTCCSRRHPYWPNWREIKMHLEETNVSPVLFWNVFFLSFVLQSGLRALIQLLHLSLCTVRCLLSVCITVFVRRLGCATVCTVSEDKPINQFTAKVLLAETPILSAGHCHRGSSHWIRSASI